MKLYEYENYEEYKKLQIAANKQKLHAVWCSKTTVKRLHEKYGDKKNILCHGARNGTEVKWFGEVFDGAKVLGTDISPTANDYDNMVEWDFHERNEQWCGEFDLVYSNSFDHSYSPEKCLKTWTDQVSEDGILCVELMVDGNNKSSRMDPLQISKGEFLSILDNYGFEEVETFFVSAVHGNSRVVVCRRI